jgi:small conductance mechanosensitive channel
VVTFFRYHVFGGVLMDAVINYIKGFFNGKNLVIEKAAEVIAIIILTIIIVKLGKFIIRKFFEKRKKIKYIANNRKLDTMASLIASIYKYTIYTIAVVTIFSSVFRMTPVLAAAGVGGVAIGFGAQSLIKDIISGFFIVFENQYSVGDLISVDSMTGIVEEMELRITKLRNANGDLHMIPNGEIKKVTNHSRGLKLAVVDIPLPYNSDIEKAVDIANKICSEVGSEFDTIVEQPKVLGITELNKDYINLRITAKTRPNEQGPVERRIMLCLTTEFKQENILKNVWRHREDRTQYLPLHLEDNPLYFYPQI